jgi:hypothetical protein
VYEHCPVTPDILVTPEIPDGLDISSFKTFQNFQNVKFLVDFSKKVRAIFVPQNPA